MDYFFITIFPKIMIGIAVITLIMDVDKHLYKKKMIKIVLQSEEKRQAIIRMNSQLISIEKRALWLVLGILPLDAIAALLAPELLPILSASAITMLYLLVFGLEDYLYRKSFLKAIDMKLESETI